MTLADPVVEGIARKLDLDQGQFAACWSNDATMDEVYRGIAEADRYGLSATPAFLIGALDTDGQLSVTDVLSGAHAFADFAQIIDRLLSRDQSNQQTRRAK